MTKEDFRDAILEHVHNGTFDEYVNETIDEFFESNVCIPKGENRHDSADELHALIEGSEVQGYTSSGWEDLCSIALIYPDKYRFKPLEPIYEWQWVLETAFVGEVARTSFMTEIEYENIRDEVANFVKDESTKRERK